MYSAVSGFHIGFWVVCIRPLFFWARSPLTRGATLIVQFLFFITMPDGRVKRLSFEGRVDVSFARFAPPLHSSTSSSAFAMLVAIGHYLVNPSAPQSISFQLSYTAVFAILLTLQKNNVEQLLLQYSFRGHSQRELVFVPVQISLAAWSGNPSYRSRAFGGASPYFCLVISWWCLS